MTTGLWLLVAAVSFSVGFGAGSRLRHDGNKAQLRSCVSDCEAQQGDDYTRCSSYCWRLLIEGSVR